ncbi:archaellin/type IV pilin N-terminal domain-containing protein [Halobellus salinus]|nr:archaellin/type IV pilin N-terminal domain-containing protein [Halobellus salinus]
MEFIQFNGESENRAQVGIGTLIVFIAMVLVAAIAAGVLVNTAGFLQATAEDTGQESVDQVTERIEVINEHATVGPKGTDGDRSVANLTLTVGLASGADATDLNATTIKYLSEDNVATLTNNTAALNGDPGTDTAFNVTPVEATDSDDSFGVLNSNEDRYELTINAEHIEGNSDGDGLEPSETVQLEITTQSGGTTEVVLTMPDQLAGSEEGDPVPI